MIKQSTLTIRIPEEVKAKAQQKAQSEGESLSTIIRQLLRDWSKQK